MNAVWQNDDLVGLIVSYLTESDLRTCATAHRSLYHRWLAKRYRKLDIQERCKQTKTLLRTLAYEGKAIAPCIRELRLLPWPVKLRTDTSKSPTEAFITQISLLWDPSLTKERLQQELDKKLRKDSELIADALKAMTGVVSYEVLWDGALPYHSILFHAALSPLSSPAREFAPWKGLRRLSLCLPLPLLASLAPIYLPQLDELTYTFATGNMSSQAIINAHDGFIVFLHNTYHSLRRLSIVSDATCLNLDTSWLYRMLSPPLSRRFTQLKSISVSFPSDGQQLSEPEHFVKFLHVNPTIKDVEIYTTRSGPRTSAGKPGCTDVIYRILCGLQSQDDRSTGLPKNKLRTLTICLPAHIPVATLLSTLRAHASTLKVLSLRGRPMRMDDIRAIIRILSSDGFPILESFGFRLCHTPQSVLTNLAESLPSLRALQIDFSAVGEAAARQYVPRFGAHVVHRRDVLVGWPLEKLMIGNSTYAMHVPIAETLRTIMPNLTVRPF